MLAPFVNSISSILIGFMPSPHHAVPRNTFANAPSMISFITEGNIPDTNIIKSSVYTTEFTPFLPYMRRFSYAAINRSTGEVGLPYGISLLTALFKWVRPRSN